MKNLVKYKLSKKIMKSSFFFALITYDVTQILIILKAILSRIN
jgi:hypothetical protein